MTITGMTDMNLPIMPSTKNSGIKAAIEVIIENTTGVPTSSVPSMAARPKGFPCTRWEKMFSPTMIASSTTMPKATIKANSDSMLIEASKGSISTKAPKKLMGMPIITQKAKRKSRKKLRQMKTSTRPRRALRISKSMRPRRMRASSRA